ncbi:hypothetical protein [Nocardia seriolae]|uniref:Chloride channel protein n=1 Tax=Nocardia seriolae TaxID=37332 RepID=A0ABC9Z5L7_9NOCA|nr:hypothetical protein [Nocardia seriolae]APA96492.1 hypothetical protein NS506_02427 [Nocardia seriolae]WKY51162.1 hypothetical protein Q5P07_30035 [Nocardia seriolae]WNJ57849.1 hypothetical protein RMO66_31365 [Nocardia seriolae]BAW04901.1 hypothetical protein NSERUTF1_1693 [Nocardia seriolae]BEK90490.1 hypothetical protein NSERKGN1266_64410 [Nocardia seriolae]
MVGIAYPRLFGNGHGIAAAAFLGDGTAELLLALAILKPLATAV